MHMPPSLLAPRTETQVNNNTTCTQPGAQITAQIENAIRLLMVKTVVIKMTVTPHPPSD
jgi:hypothetical protein